MSLTFCKRMGWGLLVGGLVILALTAASNYFRGDLLGVSQAGKWISSIGSVSIDVVGIVGCGLGAGACWASRRWGWGIVLTVALVFSVLWSANSILSFQAAERISAAKTRETANSRVEQADTLSRESVRKTIDFAGKARSSSARDDYLYANEQAIKSFRDAKVEVRVEPDAGAAWYASLVGWKLETVQLTEATYFALLLIFLKSVCFSASGFFLSWSPESSSRSVSSTPKGGSGGDGETLKTPAAPKDKQPATVAAKQAEIVPLRKAEPSVPGSPPPKPQTVSEYLKEHAGITYTSQAALAKASGFSPAKVSRELKRLDNGRGKVKRSKHKRGAHAVTYERNAAVFG